MRRWNLLVIILAIPLLCESHGTSFAQTPEEQTAAPPAPEFPAPDLSAAPDPAPRPPEEDEHRRSESTEPERIDAIVSLTELRGAARTFPADAAARLQLAQGLYRVGDLDAALDECRIALKLQPNNPEALLQLGIIDRKSTRLNSSHT